MTRTQATIILAAMLIAVEQSGISKHQILTFGTHSGTLAVFERKESNSLQEVRKLLCPLVPIGMMIDEGVISETSTRYLNYSINY